MQNLNLRNYLRSYLNSEAADSTKQK